MRKIICLAALCVVCLLAGCHSSQSKEEADPAKGVAYTETPAATAAEPTPEPYVACIDMQAVTQNVIFAGNAVEFPASLASLGVNLAYADIISQRDNKTWYTAAITDGLALNTNAEMYSEGALVDGKVYELQANAFNGVSLSVMGIGTGATYDQIRAVFGEPSSTSGTPEANFNVYYENCADEFLMFGLEQGQVTSLMLHYLPAEWR